MRMRHSARSSPTARGRFVSLIAAVMRSSMDIGTATGSAVDWTISRAGASPRCASSSVIVGRRRGGAVFDGEREFAARATQIQVRIAPGVELGGAAQRLAVAHAAGGFAGVMHHEHGELVLSLQGAQVREQRGDFAAGVFVDAVQAHGRIEHQEARLQLHDGVFEAGAVSGLIEAYGGGGDDVHVEVFELAVDGDRNPRLSGDRRAFSIFWYSVACSFLLPTSCEGDALALIYRSPRRCQVLQRYRRKSATSG